MCLTDTFVLMPIKITFLVLHFSVVYVLRCLLPGGAPQLNLDFGAIQVPQPGGSRQNTGGGITSGATAGANASGMGSDDPAVIRDMLLNSPHDLAILKERNPPLADALLSGDLGKMVDYLLSLFSLCKQEQKG